MRLALYLLPFWSEKFKSNLKYRSLSSESVLQKLDYMSCSYNHGCKCMYVCELCPWYFSLRNSTTDIHSSFRDPWRSFCTSVNCTVTLTSNCDQTHHIPFHQGLQTLLQRHHWGFRKRQEEWTALLLFLALVF